MVRLQSLETPNSLHVAIFHGCTFIGVVLLLSLSALLPSPLRPVDLCLATVICLAFRVPGMGSLIAAFVYGTWMDAVHSRFPCEMLTFVAAYGLIRLFTRFAQVASPLSRTFVAAGIFLLDGWARVIVSTLSSPSAGQYFHWTSPLHQLVFGAAWSHTSFFLFDRLQALRLDTHSTGSWKGRTL